MKKIFLIVILAVLSIAGFVFADDETIDISKWDNDSLLALQEAIENEVIIRGLSDKKTNILSGTLKAGVDIPAGKYILSMVPTSEYPIIYVKDENDDQEISYCSAEYGNPCMVSLSEGQLLKITWASAIAYKVDLDW